MDRHTAYARRLEQSSRREKVFAALAVMGVAAGVAGTMLPDLGYLLPDLPEREAPVMAPGAYFKPATASHAAPPAAQASGVRKIYPYSIIPGGVADSAELARVLRSDAVVSAHYAGFDVANARAVTVTVPRAVYVSYRKGDQVYWTKKKIMLVQGETLLTDGSNEMRARCANRISDVPQFPVESHGPTEAELDTVIADATDGGSLMAVAAGMGDFDEGAANGQSFQTASFPYAAGLDRPLDTRPPERSLAQAGGMPGLAQSPVSYGGRLGGGATGDTGAGSSGAGETGTGGGDTGSGTPGTNTPGTGTPGTNTPGTSTPGTNTPGTSTPGTNTPGTGTPGASNPGTGTPGTNNPGSGGTPTTPDTGAGPDIPGTPDNPPLTPDQPVIPGDTVLEPEQPTEVPEPGTLWLGGAALAAMAWLRRKGPRSAR